MRSLGVVIAVALGAMLGCKGKGTGGTVDAGIVSVGTPLVVQDRSWTVVEASDRGQSLPATSDGEAIQTPGRFVQVHFRIQNNGSTEISRMTAPDLVYLGQDTGRASHFLPHKDGFEHLPKGAENLDHSDLPAHMTKDYWSIYDVAADAKVLHVFFGVAVPQIDLGPLATAPTTVAAAPTTTAAVPSSTGITTKPASVCADPDLWLKPLKEDATALAAVMPTLRAKNAAADKSTMFLLRTTREMQQETSARAVSLRARLATLQSQGLPPSEAQSILPDLVKGLDTTATGFEKYAEAFKKVKTLGQAVEVEQLLREYPATMTRLDTELRAKCKKLPSGVAPAAASAQPPSP